LQGLHRALHHDHPALNLYAVAPLGRKRSGPSQPPALLPALAVGSSVDPAAGWRGDEDQPQIAAAACVILGLTANWLVDGGGHGWVRTRSSCRVAQRHCFITSDRLL